MSALQKCETDILFIDLCLKNIKTITKTMN
jgi:hypothetical protein